MKAIRVNKFALPILAVVALLGSVLVAQAAGLWQTSGRDDILLDESGQPDPAGIKGWMTLADLSATYGVPQEALYVMLGAGADIPADTPLKDMEALLPDFEVSTIRDGVAAYLDGSWAPDDGPYGAEEAPLPPPEATPEPEPTATAAAIEDHVPLGTGDGTGLGDGTGPEIVLPADGSPLPSTEIKGRMTLQEVINLCQVPFDYIVAELGLPEDVDSEITLRDLASRFGFEVLTLREVVDRYQAEN
jgi:hypothetical protein